MTVSHDKDDGASEDNNNNNMSVDLRGDPSMTVIPAINQYLSAYT